MANKKKLSKFYQIEDGDAYEEEIGSNMPIGNACNPGTRSGAKKRRASRSGHGSSKKTKTASSSGRSGSGKRRGGGGGGKAGGSKMKTASSSGRSGSGKRRGGGGGGKAGGSKMKTGKTSKSKGTRKPCRPPGPFGDYLRDYWNAKRRVDKRFNKKITDAVRDAARCWRNLTPEQRLYYTRRYCKGYQSMKKTGQWCGSRRLQKLKTTPSTNNRKSGMNSRGKNRSGSRKSKSK